MLLGRHVNTWLRCHRALVPQKSRTTQSFKGACMSMSLSRNRIDFRHPLIL